MMDHYTDCHQLAADQLELTRALLRVAVEACSSDASSENATESLREMSALEVAVDARTRASTELGIELPSTWLRSRLGLSASEERVLWILAAQELCPIATGS